MQQFGKVYGLFFIGTKGKQAINFLQMTLEFYGNFVDHINPSKIWVQSECVDELLNCHAHRDLCQVMDNFMRIQKWLKNTALCTENCEFSLEAMNTFGKVQ